MGPKEGRGGGSGSTGKGDVVAFTFLRYRWIRDVWSGVAGTGTRRGGEYFLYKQGVAAANQRERCNGRGGDGDKTTFARTQSGRHKCAKASRRLGLKGAVHLLDQNDEFVRRIGKRPEIALTLRTWNPYEPA